MKWEYWFANINMKDMTKALDEAGMTGWELVWAERIKGAHEYQVIFKRPVEMVAFKGLDDLISSKTSADLPSYGKPITMPWRGND